MHHLHQHNELGQFLFLAFIILVGFTAALKPIETILRSIDKLRGGK